MLHRWDPELFRRVGEKADTAGAVEAVLTWLRPIAVGVEPALKDPVSKLTGISLLTNTCAQKLKTSKHEKPNCNSQISLSTSGF